MVNSINTNIGAQIALQNLNSTNRELASVQKRISTGLNVADARDNGAAFAVAQGLRSDIKALGAVNSQLGVASGALDVAIAGATNVSNQLGEVREVLVRLADENLDADQRARYGEDYSRLKTEITAQINASQYNGQTLIASGASNINVIADVNGNQISLLAQDLASGVVAQLTAATNAAAAQALLTAGGGFGSAESAIGTALNSLAGDARRIEGQQIFNSALIDATEVGLGSIVDADLAKESARLQALQIKQQLGSQSLGIANQAPQILLSLFQ